MISPYACGLRSAKIAEKYGAAVAIAEVPPGPPVLATLVAEVYGNSDEQRLKLAKRVKEIFNTTTGVVDIDWYREAEHKRLLLEVDKEKAALNGLSEGVITRTVQIAVQGLPIDLFHQPADKEDIAVILQLPASQRARIDSILNISLRSTGDVHRRLGAVA